MNRAVENITEAWTSQDIQLIARHTRKDQTIAVYLKGKYQYSIDTGDYLDMTRDAFRANKTLRFKLDRVEKKQRDVYVVTGRHTYKNRDSDEKVVLVNYVLEKIDDEYVITQVGSAPEKLEEEE